MRKPISGEGKFTKICKYIVDICEHWTVEHILRPIIFLLPPILLTNIATKKGLHGEITSLLGDKFGTFLNQSALLIIVGAYLYIVIIKGIYACIKHYARPEKELGRDDILLILKSLNLIVGDKSKRISDSAKTSLSCPKEIFINITKPEQQLKLLVAAIKGVFESLDSSSNASYRVGLLKIDTAKKPIAWVHFEPNESPPKTSLQQLSSPSSTVSHCIKNNNIVVIEDIEKELKKKSKDSRRYASGASSFAEGAQLCYPITHSTTGNIEYVITIAGDKKKCMEEKHTELYRWILDHFVLRISLEHSLLILKEKSNEQKNTA